MNASMAKFRTTLSFAHSVVLSDLTFAPTLIENCNLDLNSASSWDIATCIRDLSVFDPSEGRVYISYDIVFDEHVFPFSTLHPNVGAQLRSEITLLPPSLLPSNASFGDASLHDQHFVLTCDY
jgi:hypothetical protein